MLAALTLLPRLSGLGVVSPFLGIGVNRGGSRRTVLNDRIVVVMGIFHARCLSDEWGELTIPIILI